MKTLSLILCCVFAIAVGVPAAEPSKEAERDQQQAAALVKEVQAQQAEIADNQTKIDAKLASIAEAVRQAKIYASRGR
jgi:ABC-type transporter MlaC component